MACEIDKWKSEVVNLTDKLQEAELRTSLKAESNSKLIAQMQEHTEVQQTEKSSEQLENITSSSLLSRQQQDQAAEGPDVLETLEAATCTEPSEKLQETENRSRDILNAAKKPRESLKPKEAAPEHPNILASPNESDDSKEETEEDEVDALQTSQVTNTVTGCSETSTEQITVDEAHVEEQEEEENKEESPEVEKTDREKKKTSPKWRRRLARIFTFGCAGGEHEDD
ncbi:neuromodulin-like [Amphiprion ocellaris]|uniref:neuromodulin-like n=1 Tax=Amphiprion ocellaris TaxID=80972 RepID=UPI002410D8CD|nr:neuromodulin-like [Amphiprion ocellaris]